MNKKKRQFESEVSKNRQKFLRSFFSEDGYQEKEVNGFWLVKQGGGSEVVAIYSAEAFSNYKAFQRSVADQKKRQEERNYWKEDDRIKKLIKEKGIQEV